MDIAFLTDIGKVRETNEDKILVDVDKKVIILADGMGGHIAGEIASDLAVSTAYNTTCEKWIHSSKEEIEHFTNVLLSAFSEANTAVWESSQSDDLKGMGTTLLEVIMRGKNAYICSVGDSKAYLMRKEEMEQLTTDHTVANYYLAKGEDPKFIPKAYNHMLTKVIGTQQTVEPDLRVIALKPKDILLLTTDGLTDMVSESEIKSVLVSSYDTKEMANQLVKMANDNGGKDNVTVAIYKH
jgi:protein phosphatase